jgi:sugar phosphate isomerase/epimerase
MPLNRRDFLELATSASASVLMSSLNDLASYNKPAFEMNKDFQLKVLATNWGFPGSLDEYCARAKKEGYDGIEIWWPLQKKDQDELFDTLKKYGLEVGFLCGSGEAAYDKHLTQFRNMVNAAATQKLQRPLYINCHSGRDHFSFEQNSAFIEHTIRVSKDTGIVICHETHRSRIMFAAHITKQFIEKFPDLHLTFDVSHWCNVHESLLQDQKETVELALSRVEHIHARIGHPEGPQVNDPRAPEWNNVVKQHFEWWDKIIERKRKEAGSMTVLTEFGPPDYMPTLAYTRQPLADQWAINVHMMNLLRKRYQS